MPTMLLAPVWAGSPPMPTVQDGQLRWSTVPAKTINVHRGDGSYVESLPGDATSWTAPTPGDYYLVAADRGDWRDWPRSDTVTVPAAAAGNAPAPAVEGDSLHWPAVSAYSINVHRSDGTYVTTLPGNATSWRAPAPGGYYLVATDFLTDWPDWRRSVTVTVEGDASDPTIGFDNHEEILRNVISLINAEALDAGRVRFDELADGLARDGTPPVQWEEGEIVVSAEDGSRVALRPAANDPARVEIRLNGADEPVPRAWSEGFQVRCPENFASGCGR